MSIRNFTRETERARRFGVHEISIKAVNTIGNPFDIECFIIFRSLTAGKEVKVRAFYDGDNTWRARLYVAQEGKWEWISLSPSEPSLNNKSGKFTATDSNLRGMLRKHQEDPRQWVTDDGKWFHNINDTAYMLFNKSELHWKKYIEDVAALGITSVRVGSLGGIIWSTEYIPGKVEAYADSRADCYPWDDDDMSKFDLDRFRTTDERLIWMLNNHPDMYIQFILFGLMKWGKDDTGEGWKAIPWFLRKRTMDYMIARWAAFPQLFWLVINDMHCSDNYPNNQEFAREVGRYFSENDPWHHLISVGPNRFAKFPFTTKDDLEWVSYIHLESSLALEATEIEEYRLLPLHIFLGEDRYEQGRTDHPKYIIKNPVYYYKWFFWSWTLSGGSASYGGRWARIHPYSQTSSLEYHEPFGYVKYIDALEGLDQIRYLKEFFENRKLSLCGFVPANELACGLDEREKNGYIKLMRRGIEEILIYHPNALCAGTDAACDKSRTVRLRIDLRDFTGKYEVEWYSPSDGTSIRDRDIEGNGYVDLNAPWPGKDAVLYLKRKLSLSGE